ncbi:MAG TPA: FUSC family protein [Gammaproteobacteria bacterium]|jgi:hypothetical protein|nr:FUSC family protein [Gammaproteobacteria bacterium]
MFPSSTKQLKQRRFFSIIAAVAFAAIFAWYSPYHDSCWTVLSAFLVMYVNKGSPWRQGILFFLSMAVGVFLSVLLIACRQYGLPINILFILLCLLSGLFIFAARYFFQRVYVVTIIATIAFIAAWFFPIAFDAVREIYLQIALGALIALLSRFFIDPLCIEPVFCAAVVPILELVSECMMLSTQRFLQLSVEQSVFEDKMNMLMNHLKPPLYPEWIFELGFNPALRAGSRSFLIQLDQLIEAIFSMYYLISEPADAEMLAPIANSLLEVVQKNQELVVAMICYFQGKEIPVTASDYISDIAVLESVVSEACASLMSLSMDDAQMVIVDCVRNQKDMRILLLNLTKFLPTTPMKVE